MRLFKLKFVFIFGLIAASLSACVAVQEAFETEAAADCEVAVAETTLAAADGRAVAVRIVSPCAAGAYPVIVFSHGAFQTTDGYDAVLKPWAGEGYIIAAATHLDARASLDDPSGPQQASAEERARIWRTRRSDMTLMLDNLEALEEAIAVEGVTVDGSRLAAAGHSYGAVTAQALAGAAGFETDTGARFQERDERIKAVIALSPPPPFPGLMDAEGLSQIAAPTLVQTGTADQMPPFVNDWKDRRASFEAPEADGQWLIVMRNIDHYLNGRAGRMKPENSEDDESVAALVAMGAAFLDLYVNDDDRGRDALNALMSAGAPDGAYWIETR